MVLKAIGVLFDKDGTLLDFEATFAPACAVVARELAGGDEERAARLSAMAGFDLAAERFLPGSILIGGTADDFAAIVAPLIGGPLDPDLAKRIDNLFVQHTRSTASAFEGVEDALDALRAKGLSLGIATNDCEDGARVHAELAGIYGHFSFFAGYDSGHGAKPGPGMVLAFAEHLTSPPERIVMVGDSLHDLHAARAAGAIAVGITTGLASREELAPHADYVIDSLSELSELPPLSGL